MIHVGILIATLFLIPDLRGQDHAGTQLIKDIFLKPGFLYNGCS